VHNFFQNFLDLGLLCLLKLKLQTDTEMMGQVINLELKWFENKTVSTRVEKFTDSKNAMLLDLRRKITKLSRKNRFRTGALPGAWPS